VILSLDEGFLMKKKAVNFLCMALAFALVFAVARLAAAKEGLRVKIDPEKI
jgi:hypothetical protein